MKKSRAEPLASPSNTVAAKPRRVYSCVFCQQRKVKCDKKQPCLVCAKAGIPCIQSTPTPPQRRRRKAVQAGSQADRKDSVSSDGGRNVDDSDSWQPGQDINAAPSIPKHLSQPGSSAEYSSPDKELSISAVSDGTPRFLENNLWTGLSDEFRDPRESLYASGDDNRLMSSDSNDIEPDGSAMLFESSLQHTNFIALHPHPAIILRLWQTYIDNVDPLTKIFHVPTVQEQILEASSHLDNVPKGLQALMFAIYAMAVTSLNNSQCINITGEPRAVLLARYQDTAQQALIKAGFLRSADVTFLQAYTLFLLSVRQKYNSHSLWILTGVAVRIGRRIGLHHDGASISLSPYETEMRRRLWWQIVLLDSHSAQLSGSEVLVSGGDWNTKVPSNINDCDLSPETKEMPPAHVGATEMIHCLIRYEFRENFAASASMQDPESRRSEGKVTTTSGPLANNIQSIDKLENRLESKYLRYCDPLRPLHVVSAALARSSICKMRLLARHPRQYPDKGASLPQEEKDSLFSTSLKMMEYDTLCQSTPSLRKFLWHVNVSFQLDAFVFLLIHLRSRPPGQLTDNAWEQIDEVYHYHPDLVSNSKNTLYVAIGSLTVRVWELHEVTYQRQFQIVPAEPTYITLLRSQRKGGTTGNGSGLLGSSAAHNDVSVSATAYAMGDHQRRDRGSSTNLVSASMDFSSQMDLSANFDPLDMDCGQMDWEYWNNLFQANEMAMAEGNGQQFFS